jgi:hypothetical protein
MVGRTDNTTLRRAAWGLIGLCWAVGAMSISTTALGQAGAGEKKFDDYLSINHTSILLKENQDRYEGQLTVGAGPSVRRSISFGALLLIEGEQIPCDLTPARLAAKSQETVLLTVPISKISDPTQIAAAKVRFHLTAPPGNPDLANLSSGDLPVHTANDLSTSSALNEFIEETLPLAFGVVVDWLKLNWLGLVILALVVVAFRTSMTARQESKRLLPELEQMRLKYSQPKWSLKGDIIREVLSGLQTELLNETHEKISGLEAQISQLQQSLERLNQRPDGTAPPQPRAEPSGVVLAELIQTYNQFTPDTRGEWEHDLKVKYGNRLARARVRIEDERMLNPNQRVPLERQPYGNFLLILTDRAGREGYFLPVPWLRFDSATRTDLIRPFYNLPDAVSDGRIEAIEQPAYVKEADDGLWDVVQLGRIRFGRLPMAGMRLPERFAHTNLGEE